MRLYVNSRDRYSINCQPLTLSAIGGGTFNPPPPLGKTAITTPKSNDTDLKKFDFS